MATSTRAWFDGRYMVRRIPRDAIEDCTAPGQDASDAVRYWITKLHFTAPAAETREYLQGYGAWESDELADDARNLQRLFWIICGNLRENPRTPIYLER